MAKVIILITFILTSLSYSLNQDMINMPTGEDYVKGEDGIKRMYVNIWGHVSAPGPYLVYEDIDIVTLLSIAGGPLDGADLSKIKIISQQSSEALIINIEDFSKTNNFVDIDFKPYDTIVIKPTTRYYLSKNAAVINVFLQLLNLGITLNQ